MAAAQVSVQIHFLTLRHAHPMTADDYATLMDFLATRFARMDARLEAIESRLSRVEVRQDAMEARLTRAEVLWESMRDDIRGVAEGVVAVGERLDRFQGETNERFAEHDRRFDGLDRGVGGLQVHFDRFAVDFGTVQLDHGARIEALERHRRRRGPGG
jgi:chromosome segregation ATPase